MSESDGGCREVKLTCPVCGQLLLPTNETLACDQGHPTWRFQDGFLTHTGARETAGSELSSQAQKLLLEVAREGWQQTIHYQLPNTDMPLYRQLYDPRRIDWLYVTDLSQRRLALDLGAGMGARAGRLARLFHHVIAIEPDPALAQFAALFLQQEGIENITVICTSLDELPLAPESCDFIVSSGDCTQGPRYRELAALLRPSGTLCLEVDAPGLCKPSQCRRLLQQAGYTGVTAHAAFPSAQRPRVLIPFADPAKLSFAVNLSYSRRRSRLGPLARVAHRLAATAPVARLACQFSRASILSAQKPAAAASPEAQEHFLLALRQRLLREWCSLGLPGPPPAEMSIVQLSGNWDRGGKVNWFIFPKGASNPVAIAKIARTPADSDRLQNECATTRWLGSLDEKLGAALARIYEQWEVEGHAVALYEAVTGNAATAWLAGRPSATGGAKLLRACLPFLLELSRHTRQPLAAGTGHPYLQFLTTSSAQAAQREHYPETTKGLIAALGDLTRQALSEGLPDFTTAHHGDMSAGDILGAPDRLRVLDWEWSVREGLPFLDFVHLALSAASPGGPEAVAATTKALVSPATSGNFGEITSLAAEYCEAVGLKQVARKPLAAAAILELMLRKHHNRLSETDLTVPSKADASLVAAQALAADGF